MSVKGPTKTESHKTESKPDPRANERARALEGALGDIEKAFGKGTIMRLGDGALIKEIVGISTGSIGLDMCLGGKASWRSLDRNRPVKPP